jgi:hypothetical protein
MKKFEPILAQISKEVLSKSFANLTEVSKLTVTAEDDG